ncbi:hypothetical protein Lalb_Chr06g0166211 [Lupinus albus]|uniref:Reverse transcriptase domain-containing protein n=1 Tax=Lupinus albus TaxID=3870 RepID=A0A6A4QDV2_LUPAL|nr:hypothetical protein Lalb_Chr06g0166211 [Lupinus albus]
MKYILQLFEACSSLKVNFNKCSLSDVNIPSGFVDGMAGYLNCKRDSWPLKFLGIPVGANYRRKEVSRDMVSNMSKRLAYWESQNLPFGGRVVSFNVGLPWMLNYWKIF